MSIEGGRGELVVIGSGISVAHLTAEAKGWIEAADKVLYCVADAPTERLILQLNKHCESLYRFYGEGKNRADTYREMVNRTLECVRQDQLVCAVYYGHPGIFVNPGHRAVAVAKQEGYRARMLPAVSSIDCMFCDIGFDPSEGCMMYEATDLLVRQRTLDPRLHCIVWQIACVGDLGFSFNGFDGRNTDRLVTYLLKFYPAQHPVVVYEAAQFPVCEPVLKNTTIGEIGSLKLSGIDTLYIPPTEAAPVHLAALRELDLNHALDGVRLEPVSG